MLEMGGGWRRWRIKAETALSESRLSFENCSPHIATLSMKYVWNFVLKNQNFYLKTVNHKYVSICG